MPLRTINTLSQDSGLSANRRPTSFRKAELAKSEKLVISMISQNSLAPSTVEDETEMLICSLGLGLPIHTSYFMQDGESQLQLRRGGGEKGVDVQVKNLGEGHGAGGRHVGHFDPAIQHPA